MHIRHLIMLLLAAAAATPAQSCNDCHATNSSFPISVGSVTLTEATTCTPVGGNSDNCVITGTVTWSPGTICCTGVDWADDQRLLPTEATFTGTWARTSASATSCTSIPVYLTPAAVEILCTIPRSLGTVTATVWDCNSPQNILTIGNIQFTASKTYECGKPP